MKWLSTLGSGGYFSAYAVLIWLSGPFAAFIYFSTSSARGSYPASSDSIAIPILTYSIGWLVATLPFVAILLPIVRRYPGSIPLHAWNKERPLACFLWTLPFMLWAIYKAFTLFEMLSERFLVNAVYDAGWIVLSVWLRAAAIGRFAVSPDTARTSANRSEP